MSESARWDVFCRVVDNYGDVGVGWRLARELVTAHARQVTLWIDDLATLARIAPGVDAACDAQKRAGVTIRRWTEPFPGTVPADVVVEAFGCGLPETYVAAMEATAPAPVWFILEYLSAEAWTAGVHGLPSPHPRRRLVRRFWFPGFTPESGGLLHEDGLLGVRDAVRGDAAAARRWWYALGVPPAARNEIRVSLFCYANPVLPALFDAWAEGDVPVACLVPDGIAVDALDRYTGGSVPHRHAPYTRGRLTIHAIPFLAQDDYDRLLWHCAVNFVRGEDSFVRAQWAGRAFAWHIYPQAEGAHWRKLDAFLDRYAAGLGRASELALRRFWHAWNGAPNAGPIASAWLDFADARPHLDLHTDAWAERLASRPSLAAALVKAAAESV